MAENNFWKNIKKIISVSAPMAGVTDAVFRKILAEFGKPDIIYTEMISLAGVRAKGAEAFADEMKFEEKERPIVFQFFGSLPEEFMICGKIAKEYGADGIDINMGCPDKTVEKQGAGAALIKNPSIVKEIICATKDYSFKLPVSVKTRLGYHNASEMEKWITSVAETIPAAIIIHGRTRAEKRKGRANWEHIKKAGEIIKSIDKNIKVIGNGDVVLQTQGIILSEKAGIDGYMAGRALIGNPWFFIKNNITKEERISAAKKHIVIFNQLFGETKKFDVLKKHLTAYISGFNGAKELRATIMKVKNTNDALNALS